MNQGRIQVPVSGGKGATLFRSDGSRLIDMNSGFGVAAIGYSNPRWVESLASRAATLSHGVSPVVPHTFETEALHMLRAVLGREISVVLTTGGAEAIEVALKVARLVTGRSRVLTFSGAYHGQSLGTLGVTSQSAFREPLRGVFPYGDVAPFPNTHGRPLSDDELSERAALSLAIAESLLIDGDGGQRDIGAVLVEPMQNFSGYRTLPRGFGESLTLLCRQAGALLISDEIFVGFGRCGAYELSPSVGLAPDIQCFGKAMTGGFPAGVCVAAPELLAVLQPKNSVHLHSPTFANTPMANAAVATAIECLISMDAPTRAIAIGTGIHAGLSDLVEECTWLVDLRGIGAAQALVLDFGDTAATRDGVAMLRQGIVDEGVLVLDSGAPWGNTIALCPPLVLSEEELAVALAGLRRAIQKMDLRARRESR